MDHVGDRAKRPEERRRRDVWPRRDAAGARVRDEPEAEEAVEDQEIEEHLHAPSFAEREPDQAREAIGGDDSDGERREGKVHEEQQDDAAVHAGTMGPAATRFKPRQPHRGHFGDTAG